MIKNSFLFLFSIIFTQFLFSTPDLEIVERWKDLSRYMNKVIYFELQEERFKYPFYTSISSDLTEICPGVLDGQTFKKTHKEGSLDICGYTASYFRYEDPCKHERRYAFTNDGNTRIRKFRLATAEECSELLRLVSSRRIFLSDDTISIRTVIDRQANPNNWCEYE